MKLTRILKIRVKFSRVNFCMLISASLIKWRVNSRGFTFHYFLPNSRYTPERKKDCFTRVEMDHGHCEKMLEVARFFH